MLINNINIKLKENVKFIKLYMYLYIFLLPFNFFSGFFSNLTFILFFWWLFLGKREGYFQKIKEIFKNKPLVLFFLFIIYAILSLFWSSNLEAGIEELGYYKYYPIIVLVFFTVFKKEDVKMAFYVITFSFALYALFSLSIYMEFFTVQLKNEISNKSNPRGILPYAVVTFYMAFNVLLSIYFAIKEQNNKLKYLFLFIAIFSFFTILVNNGRMGQLSFLFSLIVLMVYYRQYLYQYKKIIILIFLLMVLCIFYLYNINKMDRYFLGFQQLQHAYENKEYVGSWGARLFMWNAATELIPKNILFGTGVGDAFVELEEYKNQNSEILNGWITHYHNHYFEYIAKFGIFGYFIFLISIVFLLKILYKQEKDFFYIALVFYSMFFINGVGDSIIQMSNFDNFFILVFVLLSITIKENSKYKIGDKK